MSLEHLFTDPRSGVDLNLATELVDGTVTLELNPGSSGDYLQVELDRDDCLRLIGRLAQLVGEPRPRTGGGMMSDAIARGYWPGGES